MIHVRLYALLCLAILVALQLYNFKKRIVMLSDDPSSITVSEHSIPILGIDTTTMATQSAQMPCTVISSIRQKSLIMLIC